MRSALCVAAVVVLGLTVAARAESKKDKDKVEQIAWKESVTPGAAVTIRLKRDIGKVLLYEGTIDRIQQAANNYEEHGEFFLNSLCADIQDGRFLLALWRSYNDRSRSEKLENGRKVKNALPNTNELIALGPNSTLVGTLRCYAYDNQNRVASKNTDTLTMKDGGQIAGQIIDQDDTKVVLLSDDGKLDLPREKIISIESQPLPHVCLNEAPHYLFPMFSQRAVSPGNTWKFRVPVIIPIEQGGGARILPTQFEVVYVGRLRDVRSGPNGSTIATVDYQVDGEFDSMKPENAARLPSIFNEQNRIIHRMNGTGSATIDVSEGRILDKTENFTFALEASSAVPIPSDKEKKGRKKRDGDDGIIDNKAQITSRYSIRLLKPGEKLKNGKVVPDYNNMTAPTEAELKKEK